MPPDSVSTETVQVTVKLYAMLTEYLPQGSAKNQCAMTLAAGVTIGDVIRQLRMPAELVHLVLINGVYVEPEERDRHALVASDVLAIWPPVAGG